MLYWSENSQAYTLLQLEIRCYLPYMLNTIARQGVCIYVVLVRDSQAYTLLHGIKYIFICACACVCLCVCVCAEEKFGEAAE